jgi:hypothetical protein
VFQHAHVVLAEGHRQAEELPGTYEDAPSGWEAVEHERPYVVYRSLTPRVSGIYDREYLDYLQSPPSLRPNYGISAFVSLHQDVWSRYSGGSGAPAWTLEAVGFDLRAIEEVSAAWLLGMRGRGHVEAERGIWPCGYQKLSEATMAWVNCFAC